jgi:PAS domain S-box-containing protein
MLASSRSSYVRHILIVAVIAGVVPSLSEGQSPRTRTVLLLRQTDLEGSLRARFDAAFTEALRSNKSVAIELYTEDIDTERFQGAEQTRAFSDYLAKKYKGRRVDVIVTQGIRPLTFARQHRQLFGNPPIVTTIAPPGLLDARDDIVGLQGGAWVDQTLTLAMTLLPDTRAVYVVVGTRDNNGDVERELRRQWETRRNRLELFYLRDLALPELISRLRATPPKSIVLLMRQAMNGQGQTVDQFEALADVLRASPVPVFTHLEDYLGYGVIGGSIWRFDTDARRVAAMAASIASGTSPRDIPSGRSTYEIMLDWQQLQRWGIPDSRVPRGSVVLFRPKSFLDQYGWYMGGGIAVLAAQFALIVGLLAQRARRRRAEEESRTHAARYRSVVDAQSELICRFLPDTTLTFVNDAYCRYWNKTRDELLGHRFIDLIPPEARAGVMERIQRLERGTESHEHAVFLPDGTQGWHHWVNSAIVDQHGRVIEYQGVGRDVTDRRRAEAALNSAEERNSAILRAIPDMMFVLTRDGTYVDYHARDTSRLLAPPDQFLGKTIRQVMPPDLAETMMNALARAFDVNEPVVIEYELEVGEKRYFEARMVPAANDQVLSIVRDVTEARRARDLNRTLAGRLIVSQEEERQRIARELHDDLSHKIALLNIDVDRLARQLPRSEHQTRLRHISTQVSDIANDLHDLSYELHPARLRTLGLLESLRVLCSEFSHQRHVHVVFTSTHPTLPKDVDSAISLCLYRIAQEALHNIARHSGARHAYVHISCEDNDICLQVADSGVGFEPHPTRHAGLGLVSMRERVSILNGKLVIHSAPGRGTRIAARIPLTPSEHGASSMSVSA